MLGVLRVRRRKDLGRVHVLDLYSDWMVLDVTGVCEWAFAILVNIGIAAIRVIRVSIGHVRRR